MGPGMQPSSTIIRLYLGTSNGLFSVVLQALSDLSFSKGNFVPVNNTKGQVWNLSEINKQLLLGHHEGAFLIKNNTASLISQRPGAWNFINLSNSLPNSQIISGVYNGINIFDFTNGQIVFNKEIKGFNESSRFVAVDKDSVIWVSHPYHGVFKIVKINNDSFSTKTYTNKNGLPALLNNHVFKIKNEVLFATEKGIYIYNQQNDQFEPSLSIKNFLAIKVSGI
jgi:ligand-binding sensor domain-containing protein